jgi:hypothetical protein
MGGYLAEARLWKSSTSFRNAVITRAWMEVKNIPGLDMRTVE